MEPGGSGDSLAIPPGSESQPNSNPSSAAASPLHGRKGINLLPEVVSYSFNPSSAFFYRMYHSIDSRKYWSYRC